MSLPRFITVSAFLLSAACTASSTEEATPDSETSAYTETFHSIHRCETDGEAHEGAGLITWADIEVGTRFKKPVINFTLVLNLTTAETDRLTDSNGKFTGAVGQELPLLVSATVDGKHAQSVDGSVVMDFDLTKPHAQGGGLPPSPGRGSATVTVDFGKAKEIIPERVRKLGVKTFKLKLNNCN